MTQDLQEVEPEQIVVPVSEPIAEMKVLEQEAVIWKDHEEEIVVKKKADISEKTKLLLFGGAMVGVSVLVYGIAKFVHYITGR